MAKEMSHRKERQKKTGSVAGLVFDSKQPAALFALDQVVVNDYSVNYAGSDRTAQNSTMLKAEPTMTTDAVR